MFFVFPREPVQRAKLFYIFPIEIQIYRIGSLGGAFLENSQLVFFLANAPQELLSMCNSKR